MIETMREQLELNQELRMVEYVCVYSCMHACMHACMHVYADVCIHVRTHIHTERRAGVVVDWTGVKVNGVPVDPEAEALALARADQEQRLRRSWSRQDGGEVVRGGGGGDVNGAGTRASGGAGLQQCVAEAYSLSRAELDAIFFPGPGADAGGKTQRSENDDVPSFPEAQGMQGASPAVAARRSRTPSAHTPGLSSDITSGFTPSLDSLPHAGGGDMSLVPGQSESIRPMVGVEQGDSDSVTGRQVEARGSDGEAGGGAGGESRVLLSPGASRSAETEGTEVDPEGRENVYGKSQLVSPLKEVDYRKNELGSEVPMSSEAPSRPWTWEQERRQLLLWDRESRCVSVLVCVQRARPGV